MGFLVNEGPVKKKKHVGGGFAKFSSPRIMVFHKKFSFNKDDLKKLLPKKWGISQIDFLKETKKRKNEAWKTSVFKMVSRNNPIMKHQNKGHQPSGKKIHKRSREKVSAEKTRKYRSRKINKRKGPQKRKEKESEKLQNKGIDGS